MPGRVDKIKRGHSRLQPVATVCVTRLLFWVAATLRGYSPTGFHLAFKYLLVNFATFCSNLLVSENRSLVCADSIVSEMFVYPIQPYITEKL
jgi:hypothetical protein